MSKYHGKPCVKCGNTERYICNNTCTACSLEQSRRWRETNIEKSRASARKWKAKNKDKVREHDRHYRQKHREKLLARKRRYYHENKAKVEAKNREWAEAHPEVVRETRRRWKRRNPQAVKEDSNKRRARKQNAPGDGFTEQEFEELCEFYDHTCLRCEKNEVPLSRDHVIPLCKGGINDISNIQPLCMPCNSKKGLRSTDYRKVCFIPKQPRLPGL